MFGTIRSKIIEVINAQATKIGVAYRTDRSAIEKYPAALVFPSESEADFHQTAASSNKETYSFTIRVIYPFVEGQDKADIALEEAVDELIGVFRDRSVLGSAADWVTPVPSQWGYQTRGTGVVRVAEIKIKAVKVIE